MTRECDHNILLIWYITYMERPNVKDDSAKMRNMRIKREQDNLGKCMEGKKNKNAWK